MLSPLKECKAKKTERGNNMKKFLTILLALCMAVSITACSTSEAPPKKEAYSDSESTETAKGSEEEVFGLNETAVFEKLKVTAKELKESNGTEYFKAEDGKIFVGVNFEIENISDETQNISSLLLFDAYADDIKCEYSISANVAFGDGTLDGEISPGKKLVGWYAVEVPQEWKQMEFEFKSDFLSGSKAKFAFNKE